MATYAFRTIEERRRIEALHRQKIDVPVMAEMMGVPERTMYAELERGRTGELTEDYRPVYRAEIAQQRMADSLFKRGRPRKAVQKEKEDE